VQVAGEWRQLNPNLLQIENEYYSTIRPKRSALSGERPTMALRRGGIEYLELRALDLDPFAPTGVNARELLFAELFLVYCLLQDSPGIDPAEQRDIDFNHRAVARRGRETRPAVAAPGPRAGHARLGRGDLPRHAGRGRTAR
jgi:glutamate--cysteine ligase